MKKVLVVLVLSVFLSGCGMGVEKDLLIEGSNQGNSSFNNAGAGNVKQADNSLPMYGGLDVIKTPAMLQADEAFISEIVAKAGTKEKGSVAMINVARNYLEKGDLETAMQRFNQAWLLDSSNREVYVGFVEILKLQGRTAEADKISKEYL